MPSDAYRDTFASASFLQNTALNRRIEFHVQTSKLDEIKSAPPSGSPLFVYSLRDERMTYMRLEDRARWEEQNTTTGLLVAVGVSVITLALFAVLVYVRRA